MPRASRWPPYRSTSDALTPRAKTHNYLNLITADLDVHARDPEAWAVLLDVNGNLCEGLGANIFTGRDGRLLTPHERYVLPGVSRATAIELAAAECIACAEADIDLYDAYTADESFITSTSFCICPVRSVNGTTIGAGTVPGPLTRRLQDAFARLVDCDFVAQFLEHLSRTERSPLGHNGEVAELPGASSRPSRMPAHS